MDGMDNCSSGDSGIGNDAIVDGSISAVSSNATHVVTPKKIENSAPWFVARDQYTPHTNGIKADTNVT